MLHKNNKILNKSSQIDCICHFLQVKEAVQGLSNHLVPSEVLLQPSLACLECFAVCKLSGLLSDLCLGNVFALTDV